MANIPTDPADETENKGDRWTEDGPTSIHIATREDFFNAYWSALDARGWPSVVLHSWKELPERIESDVDYAVSDVSAGELLGLLAAFSRTQGWRLVQIIEHEPKSYYCVCMQACSPYDWLALDVTWDYRRRGHVLVRSELLVGERHQVAGKSFAVPSPGGEFCYILAKGAAKRKDFGQIRERLAELVAEDPDGCRRAVEKAFACVLPSGCGDENHLAELAKWFSVMPCFNTVRAGRRFGIAEIGLYLRRIWQPTGIWLILRGADRSQERCGYILGVLAPLYRRIHQRRHFSLWALPCLLLRIIRTTLVVENQVENIHMDHGWWAYSGLVVNAGDDGGKLSEVLEFLADRMDTRISGI